MASLQRLLAAVVFIGAISGCSTVFDDYTASAPPASGFTQGRGHVYLTAA